MPRRASVDLPKALIGDLNPLQLRLWGRDLRWLTSKFEQWCQDRDQGRQALESWCTFLRFQLEELRRDLDEQRRRQSAFQQLAARAVTPDDRRDLILVTARELGSRGTSLWRDSRALGRWLDESAIDERFQRRLGLVSRRILTLLDRLAELSQRLLSSSDGPGSSTLWQNHSPEEALSEFLLGSYDERLQVGALRALRRTLEGLKRSERVEALSKGLQLRVTRLAQDSRLPTWVQAESLAIIASTAPDSILVLLQQRLATPESGDDLFVRRRAVQLVGELLKDGQEAAFLLSLAAEDPSDYVRQAVCQQLAKADIDACAELWLELAADHSKVVRGLALKMVPQIAARSDLTLWVGASLEAILPQEAEEMVARVGMEVLVDTYAHLRAEQPDLAWSWLESASRILRQLRRSGSTLATKRRAAQVSELLWARSDDQALAVLRALKEGGGRSLPNGRRSLPNGRRWLPEPGKSRRLPRGVLDKFDHHVVGRVLSVVAQNDFPLEIEHGRWGDRLVRGFRFRFRLWRALHELRNPAPDKRQAFRHTIGRVHYGSIRAPSARLAELAETKVPGEPLYLAEEGGWRPFLPLVDDCLSALNQPLPGTPALFFSGQGVTEMAPPPTLGGRLRAYLKLNLHFARFARLRNWREHEPADPAGYAESLQDLGFRLRFADHVGPDGHKSPADPSVTRHFPVVAPVLGPAAVDLWERFSRYALSLYENSLFDLSIFAGVVIVGFVARHLWNNISLQRARGGLSLVVGGWGTRGKSSVERLKAALFNALGHGLVSKTTGCEAMLLVSEPFGELHEIFLFRPYDKATIWEQRDVVRFASGLGSEVLLWECMGLNPAYVDVLQQQWMRDDLSTLTNTYPDHEDVQGPAGIDVPQVMTSFIPRRSRVLTSEEEMLPILAADAEAKGTTLSSVGWLEAGLIPEDVMDRFPYDEHPYNVALVSEVASLLGMESDVALKEMADRVIPDLGVLKTYPLANVNGRRLEFSNGMSANERHGCLSNWRRLELVSYEPETMTGRWTTTLVNNRADRIPRSKVFAKVLVEDIQADRHFLIGGNLSGLAGYLQQAWNEHAAQLTLWPSAGTTSAATPEEMLRAIALRHRQPTDLVEVERRLGAMLGELGTEALKRQVLDLGHDRQQLSRSLVSAGLDESKVPEVVEHHVQSLEALRDLKGLESRASDCDQPARAQIDQDFRDLAGRWFRNSLVIIDDYYASGDDIIQRISAATPPGFRNQIVGLQNIKGTGLDFVYRWQAWERCHAACLRLESRDQREVAHGLRQLLTFREWGVLCKQGAESAISTARESGLKPSQQSELDLIENNLASALRELGGATSGKTGAGWPRRVLESAMQWVEEVLDAGDAIRRRKRADSIYRDLISQRIGSARAASELQALTKRQKGGWLLQRLKAWLVRGSS